MNMMKKFNNLFVGEDDFEEVVEKEEVRQEQPKPKPIKKENSVVTKH